MDYLNFTWNWSLHQLSWKKKIIKSKEFRTNENDWFFPPYKVGNEGLNPPALHGRVGDVTARMIKLIYTHYVSLFLFLFSFLII